jgi:hypothetical protein
VKITFIAEFLCDLQALDIQPAALPGDLSKTSSAAKC